jgi:two-component sensor histidine kinase
VDRLLGMLSDVMGSAGQISVKRTGSFGVIPAEVATALVLVVTELVQNAMEHAFPDRADGLIEVRAERGRGQLTVTIRDDGIGLPEDFAVASAQRLGLQIVQTLVSAELAGTVEFGAHDGGVGTAAIVTMPLGKRPRVGG